MKHFACAFGLSLLIPGLVWTQDIEFVQDLWEVRLPSTTYHVDVDHQSTFRGLPQWADRAEPWSDWQVVAQQDRLIPARMWGPGVVVEGSSDEARAQEAWAILLGPFGLSSDDVTDVRVAKGSKHVRVLGQQQLEGLPVLGSKLQAKFHEDQLVMLASDVWPGLTAELTDELDADELAFMLEQEMSADLEINWGTTHVTDFALQDLGYAWLPQSNGMAMKVWQVEVRGRRGILPVRYHVWMDVETGEVLQRQNRVVHEAPSASTPRAMGSLPNREMASTSVVSVFGQVKAQGHASYPYEPAEELSMPHLELPLGANTYFTDANGVFNTAETGNLTGVNLALSGKYATVFTSNVTPEVVTDLVDGYNAVDAPGNVKEASAYMNVNLIHDHMRTWLPDFSDLDWSMPVNIDVAGECNAFYDGGSVNFFDVGGGCNPTSLIADVVYHEYGHAINDWFYQSYFYGFNNGAMNEGYADFWAMSLADIAEIGKGFYTDNNDGIRRYDQDPKVYPEDIVGEVHADGEIICGAWYDTHLLMGADWDLTLSLFVDAFPGLQATLSNGQEGQAYTDVLLDVLQADDDDGDLTNGTPHAQAIIEGFALHGITLFSYVELDHSPAEFVPASESIVIEAEASIEFPYVVYFDQAQLHYRTSPLDPWSTVAMSQDGDLFSATLDGLPAGTVLEYYLNVMDVFGGTSAVTPLAADKAFNANLPHYVLVGVEPVLRNDLDEYSEFGYWDMDLPTDNATTGIWTEAIPVGSLSDPTDPTTVVAPLQDHTDGLAGFAYITGLNPGVDAGIGANDVDGGHTTLVSPVIDLTPYEDPVLAYWRWYVNAPATGANPGTDWWQVEITNDGGNTWQYLENTSQQDISWRRKAFRIADVIEPTNTFQIRFIASDSTTVGEYLDGGSLIEAAVDDIILYDVADENSDGVLDSPRMEMAVWPNPASDAVRMNGWMPGSTVRVVDAQGREVGVGRANGSGQVRWSVQHWPVGPYVAHGVDAKSRPCHARLEVVR